jgi:hypothetical protein
MGSDLLIEEHQFLGWPVGRVGDSLQIPCLAVALTLEENYDRGEGEL